MLDEKDICRYEALRSSSRQSRERDIFIQSGFIAWLLAWQSNGPPKKKEPCGVWRDPPESSAAVAHTIPAAELQEMIDVLVEMTFAVWAVQS